MATKKYQAPRYAATREIRDASNLLLTGKGPAPAAGTPASEISSVMASIRQAYKGYKNSTLGGEGKPMYKVGGEGVIDRIRKGTTALEGLDLGAAPKPIFGPSVGGLQGRGTPLNQSEIDTWKTNRFARDTALAQINSQLPGVQNKQNEMLQVTSQQRAAQREAIQANQAIMSGRKARKSSATIPRLPRGAGLLVPFQGLLTKTK